jgi:hypothetical protein
MEEARNSRELILETLIEKSIIKQKVFENTKNAFQLFKDSMLELVKSFNNQLKAMGKLPMLEYKDRGDFEAEMIIGDDLLVFNMHTNVFEFDQDHIVWKSSYLQKDPAAAFCGTISIYNFLSDSFRYNRHDDLGYLIARVFVNKDSHYIVEGKRQLGFLYNDYVNSLITAEDVTKILDSAVLFTMDFDLLVPDYESVNVITVAQMQENINSSKTQTAKRLGFNFAADTNNI